MKNNKITKEEKRQELQKIEIFDCGLMTDEFIDMLLDEHEEELDVITKEFIETAYYYDYMDVR